MSNLIFLLFLFIFCIFLTNCAGDQVKKSVDENDGMDNGEINDDSSNDGLEVPTETEPLNVTCNRRQNSQVHEIRQAQHKQFPFMVAIMSDNNDYICSGTVVSNGLILTTATCIGRPVSYVLLNATKAKKDETTVNLRIIKTEKFPTFTNTDTEKDVGLIYTNKLNNSVASKIKLSNFTSTRGIVDIECVGYGLNSDVGLTKELQYIGLENRRAVIPDVDTRDLIRGYFDCIDTKVPTCFNDEGGPTIFAYELIGIVVKGQRDCIKEMSSKYAVMKKITEVLPTYTFKAWLDERIKKNEKEEAQRFATFPMKPVKREPVHEMTKGGSSHAIDVTMLSNIVGFIIVVKEFMH